MDANKKLKKLRSNLSTVFLLLFVAALFIFPSFKGSLMQGLMKIGLFQPSIPQIIQKEPDEQSLREREALAFINPQGEQIRLSDTEGKVVFINFWATWCPPCIAEMPTIQSLYDELGSAPDLVLMMVDVDNNRERAGAFLEKRNLTLPLYTPATQIPTSYLSGAIPTTLVLDKKGNVVFKKEGMGDFSSKKFKRFIQDLLDEKNS